MSITSCGNESQLQVTTDHYKLILHFQIGKMEPEELRLTTLLNLIWGYSLQVYNCRLLSFNAAHTEHSKRTCDTSDLMHIREHAIMIRFRCYNMQRPCRVPTGVSTLTYFCFQHVDSILFVLRAEMKEKGGEEVCNLIQQWLGLSHELSFSFGWLR